MKLLVTGAAGFLGRHVVQEALRRGHHVRALVRTPTADVAARRHPHPRLEHVTADLRSRKGLAPVVAGVDAVLHLAAAKSGDFYAQMAGTVVATENLLAAMDEAGVRQIVHVSSFAVYDYLGKRSFSLLDESSPLEEDPDERDAYAQTKLIQEDLVRQHAGRQASQWTVLRPGVIFGKDNLWSARLGVQAGPKLWVRTGAWGRLPLTYVENCAEAIVLAAERAEANGQVLNVVDDEPPTQRAYASFLRRHVSPRPWILPVSWTIMRMLARAAVATNAILFQGRAKVPGILIPARLHARCKPLRFSNERAKRLLGWKPRYDWREGVLRSLDTAGVAAEKSVEQPLVPAAQR